MKKKLFLIAFMLIALVSLLAISVSAQGEADDPYASYYDDVYTAIDGTPLALYEEEGGVYYALAWFYDSTNMTYESFRIGSEVNFCKTGTTTPIGGGVDFRPDGGASTIVPVFADESVTYGLIDLILLNIQQSPIDMFSGVFTSYPIQAIYCNVNLRYVNGGTFTRNTSLCVFDIPKAHERSGATICGAFQHCTNLKEIYVPKHMCLLDSAFEYSGLERVEFAPDYDPQGYYSWQTTDTKEFWFNSCQSLNEVILPQTSTHTYLGKKTFCYCTSLTEIEIPSYITSIGEAAFENATALKGISLPEGLTTLGNCAFNACSSLETLSLPTTLTTLSGNNHFKGSSLKEVIGLENTQLTSISFDMFRGQKNWKPDVIKLPNTVETISGQALADIGMKTIILSANLTSITSNALTNCLSLEAIYVPAGAPILGTGNGLYDCNSSALKLIFFEGADATAIQSYENYTPITYAEYIESPEIYATGNYIVTSTNTCFAFYGNEHDIPVDENNKCCGICERCSEKQFFDDPVHTGEWSFDGTYVTGYRASYDCIYCETDITSEDIEALFISKGYSCTVFEGAISIVQGFDINREAIARYEELTGKEVSYGVVASSVNKVVDGNIDVVNNVDGVTAIDFTTADKAEFTRFEIKVADIAEANQNTGLYACAYVIEDGAVSFISENACTAQAVAKTAATILQENPV